tara:strand:+ start:783 stop:1619 length:837 start_codon:yes stop_codon:yes gene_type:complete
MGFMSRYYKLLDKYSQLNIAEKIIFVNVILFVLPLVVFVFFYLFKIPKINFYYYFELLPNISGLLFRPWSLITYGFIHASIGHLFWNMILFYYFSTLFLNLFKGDSLIALFCLGIITGGGLFVFSYSFFPVFGGVNSSLIGSSAGVISVVIFMCTYSPNSTLRILFFNVKLIYVGIILVIFDLAQLPISNSGGHIAHLGGALFGFFAGAKMKKGYNIFKYLKTTLPQKNNKQRRVSIKENFRNDNQKKIDRILDKINESGFDSLTSEEKKALNEASND